MATCNAQVIKRFRRDARGVTAVEFGMIGMVLMLFIVGIIEVGLMMAAKGILDNAAFAASRTGKTGYKESGSTQQQTILAAIKKAASGYLDPAKITMTSMAYSDYNNIGQPEPFTDINKNGKRDAGEPFTDVNGNGSWDSDQGRSSTGASGEIVVYTVKYDWKTFTPMVGNLIGVNRVVPLTSRIVVKNEPY